MMGMVNEEDQVPIELLLAVPEIVRVVCVAFELPRSILRGTVYKVECAGQASDECLAQAHSYSHLPPPRHASPSGAAAVARSSNTWCQDSVVANTDQDEAEQALAAHVQQQRRICP